MSLLHGESRRRIAGHLAAGRTAAGVLLALLLMVLLVPADVGAQETTATIRGRVIDASGAPIANAAVEVLDERTGIIRRFTTDATGTFLATRLPPGGPYMVIVNNTQTIRVESITVADIYNLTVDVDAVQLTEQLEVVGQSETIVEVAPGPAATFSTFDLETAVVFNRDILDLYGIDPRVNIDNEDDGFEINCAGKHPRFNSITLDGISQNDRFGLNSNGYSTATGMPFPYDAISQVAVELAPADVTYGGFSACNVNAVTKSGTNTLRGNAFYEYTGDSLRGSTIGGLNEDFTSPPFNSHKGGFTVGGPIVRDRLFGFAAYEGTTTPRFLAMGFAGSGSGDEREWLSQADYDLIVNTANTVYNYDAGGQPTDGAQDEDKFMMRFDANINPAHNLSFIYNYYNGSQDRASDNDANEFEFANHFYVKGSKTKTYTTKLASNWTDAFSTEIFFSRNEMDDTQITVGPKDFGEFQISIGNNTVYLGADDSRQANQLTTDSNFFKAAGQYLMGQQVLTGGYEAESLTIFNQFVQHARGGEYRFYDDSSGNPAYCAGLTPAGRLADSGCDLSGLDRFQLGRPSRIYYGSGGGSNDPADASANFTNTLNALYFQDEIFLDEQDLTITAGLRYEFFTSDDRPVFNQAFADANDGIRNDVNIDGLGILMPRVGLTWNAARDVSVRASVGRYSGGNPNVWLSNAWSNDGITNVQITLNNYNAARSVLDGSIPLRGNRPGYDIPQELYDRVANTTASAASTRSIVLIDSDYVQPSEWKYTVGLSYRMDGGLTQFDFDYMHTELVDSAFYVDLSQTIVGTTAAGGPIYDFTNGEDNLMLTNSPYGASANIFSVTMHRYFENGLDALVGYAFTRSQDVVPMTSAVALSNFENLAVIDINDPQPGTSNYEVPHRLSFRVSWGQELFENAETRFTVNAYSQQGQPQSFGMSSRALEGDGYYGRHLLYVPDGPNDPNVVFDPDFQTNEFFNFVSAEGLSPGFVERNSKHADWTTRVDLSVYQDLPIGVGRSKARAFFRMYNLTNFLNNSWGKVNDAYFFTPVVVDATLDSQGRYVFEDFNGGNVTDLYEFRTLWQARFGVEFRF